MRIINPGFNFVYEPNAEQMLDTIEKAYRICYQSEPKGNRNSFITNKIKIGHESPLEHANISVVIETNRGVTHEIVRHRIASYSQESTRYCNYSKDKFGNELTFIRPCFWADDSEGYAVWKQAMEEIEKTYVKLISLGAKPEEARSILPNSLKTEIVCTMNLREWRHFFRLRTAERAHPQIREISVALLDELKKRIPVIFDDINTSDGTY